MSRCFPFPPPGYEKKSRTDDVNLQKKEKDKEKKRKKEKKDKEKKEKKEKREKNRSDGKHEDKKEKKEKRSEKKKDKDKDEDREKKNVSNDKKFPVQYQVPNTGRPIEKEHKLKNKNSIFSNEKLSRNHTGSNGEKLRENASSVKENKDTKFIQELDRRIKYDGGTQMPHKFPLMGHKKDEATARVVAKGNSPWQEGDERGKEKAVGNKKSDGLGIRVDTRPSVNAIVPNHAGIFQPRAEGIPKISEKNFEKMQESKEPIKGNNGDDKRGDKGKNRDREKKGHGKDKDRNKEKKKEEKAKEQVEHKNSEHSSKLKEGNKFDPFCKEGNKFDPFCKNSSSQPLGDNIKNAASDQNLKKRKDFEPNGVVRANHNWPNKLPRPSSHPFSENGSMPEPKQISASCCPDRLEAATNLKLDDKEWKINDIIEGRPIPAPSSKPVSGSASANQVAVVSVKSPHSDTKYLKQVCSVPQMDTWSELDDQEWLYNSNSLQQSKPQVESSDTDEIPLVWAEALQIEQADVCVLPYVIPY